MNSSLVNAYTATALVGVGASLLGWRCITRKREDGVTLVLLYLAGLLGAVVGAKLGFLVAEGWRYRDSWPALLSGKTIIGGLLGGYGGVEWAKHAIGYRRATGDLFAVAVPAGLALGRFGCILQGCCPGVVCEESWWTVHDASGASRWPAAHVELAFNLLFAGVAATVARLGRGGGQMFHIYLASYGAFRFAHEFARDDARWVGPLTGYHALAAALAGFGALRFIQRRRARASPAAPPS